VVNDCGTAELTRVPARTTDVWPQSRDLRLFEALREGCEEALRALFELHAPSVTALATRVLGERSLADDVVQEVFLQVWERPAAYDRTRSSVRSWLMTLAHRRAVDRVRRERSQRDRALAAAAEPVAEDSLEQVVERWAREEDRERVRRALDELPLEQLEVIRRMYFDGASGSRVARDLGIPLGTVKSRARLAMLKLRSALAPAE
jgi:RNA polymerase sigma-70 factor (ECF subfamily)